MRLPVRLATRRVPAQREHVLDPCLARSPSRVEHSSPRAWPPTQLRWAIASIPRSCLIHFVSSTVRPPRGSAGTVGHRHEVGRERYAAWSSAARSIALTLVALWGKNSNEKTRLVPFAAMISSTRIGAARWRTLTRAGKVAVPGSRVEPIPSRRRAADADLRAGEALISEGTGLIGRREMSVGGGSRARAGLALDRRCRRARPRRRGFSVPHLPRSAPRCWRSRPPRRWAGTRGTQFGCESQRAARRTDRPGHRLLAAWPPTAIATSTSTTAGWRPCATRAGRLQARPAELPGRDPSRASYVHGLGLEVRRCTLDVGTPDLHGSARAQRDSSPRTPARWRLLGRRLSSRSTSATQPCSGRSRCTPRWSRRSRPTGRPIVLQRGLRRLPAPVAVARRTRQPVADDQDYTAYGAPADWWRPC